MGNTSYYNSDTHTAVVLDKAALMEIKYAAQELINLQNSIEKAEDQIEQHPGKEQYIETRLHCIRLWKEKIEEHHKALTEGFNCLEELNN